ncbi:glycosyltransferase family 1 protein [Dyadobacter sp. CY351]|uniref:glycosyltransferase family 4 protein n=1 Tax=Dyadobacter sp. CY351 TaxID=2909337 RepID=UPI001F1FECE6|nr:glycosyltransferase family 1 protein [Dyadobacter sp. CY351]MCF2519154.1 glycosyltransferase family 4 protein [Dyadobacter sp. CY351]
MNIVFFSHPVFLGSISTQRYAKWLVEGMRQRGHQVQLWVPEPKCFNVPGPANLKKWMGYIDQYVLFPYLVKKQIRKQPKDTLYVLTDHSLGLWAPLIRDHNHIVHCHDFLAQFSAMNLIPENKNSWSGRKYQGFIREGFLKAKNFISISEKTQHDLHSLLGSRPEVSEVVYNGLVQSYAPCIDPSATLSSLQTETGINLKNGYLLHVGGNQWNKNRRGVIEIYSKWRVNQKNKRPLLMIGPEPDDVIRKAHAQSVYKNDIHFLVDKPDAFVALAYQGAAAFLFPSLAEGFGWPIAEAMSSGTPVITTSETPMTEVAGDAALFIDRRPADERKAEAWATDAAKVLEKLLSFSREEREKLVNEGLQNVKRFNSEITIEKIEKIYLSVAGNAAKNVSLNYNSDVSA